MASPWSTALPSWVMARPPASRRCADSCHDRGVGPLAIGHQRYPKPSGPVHRVRSAVDHKDASGELYTLRRGPGDAAVRRPIVDSAHRPIAPQTKGRAAYLIE